jgi:hypothetical protein
MLTVYTLVIVNALDRSWVGHLTAADLIQAQIGVFGLGTFILFVHRSHPFNIYHVAVPFCALITVFLSNLGGRAAPEGHPRAKVLRRICAALPWVGVYLLCLAFMDNPNVHAYPSLFGHVFAGAGASARKSSAPTFAQARQDELRLAADLRRLTQGGTRSIAVISGYETPLLVQADLPPYFRYSPLKLSHQHQVELVRQDFAARPPDIVAVLRPGLDQDMSEMWTELLRGDYSRDAKSGEWEIYHRRELKPPVVRLP